MNYASTRKLSVNSNGVPLCVVHPINLGVTKYMISLLLCLIIPLRLVINVNLCRPLKRSVNSDGVPLSVVRLKNHLGVAKR